MSLQQPALAEAVNDLPRLENDSPIRIHGRNASPVPLRVFFTFRKKSEADLSYYWGGGWSAFETFLSGKDRDPTH